MASYYIERLALEKQINISGNFNILFKDTNQNVYYVSNTILLQL